MKYETKTLISRILIALVILIVVFKLLYDGFHLLNPKKETNPHASYTDYL